MNNTKHPKIVIVVPIYNDWDSFFILLKRIDHLFSNDTFKVEIVVIDDSSSIPFNSANKNNDDKIKSIENIEILRLNRNMGHQKAISIALAYVSENKKAEYVIVMDGDGEDRPEDVLVLIEACQINKDKIIFGSRKERSEGVLFTIFYRLYKIVYRILTGSPINFGNFCIIPYSLLSKLVYISEIHNHFSAGCMRSKLPIDTIPTVRGNRFDGKSKMNMISLILHGLSAVSVHMDIVAVRLLIGSIFLITLSMMGILNVLIIKYLTDLAIPGWATNITIGLTIILMQAFLISLILVFLILNHRTQILFIPIYDYKKYVLGVDNYSIQ
jgi:polyisoprenyl-phosphate glycosyltransferase